MRIAPFFRLLFPPSILSICFCHFIFRANWKLGKQLSIVMKETKRYSWESLFCPNLKWVHTIDHTHTHKWNFRINLSIVEMLQYFYPLQNVALRLQLCAHTEYDFGFSGALNRTHTHTRIGYKSSIQNENILEMVAFALLVFCCVYTSCWFSVWVRHVHSTVQCTWTCSKNAKL